MKIIDQIIKRWRMDKIGTSFMILAIILGLLSLFKPSSDFSISNLALSLGISVINLLIVIIIIGGIIYLYRK